MGKKETKQNKKDMSMLDINGVLPLKTTQKII
jgi:hypothetical protein